MPKISVVTPCFNEEENVEELYQQIARVFEGLPGYTYEQLYIDNASSDRTVELVKKIASKDRRVKLIVNARNFGHIRSPVYGLLQSDGDATILMASDLQDPPEMIKDFVRKWEEGYKVVMGVKIESEESPVFFAIRKFYYTMVAKISQVKLVKNFTGYGLYDRKVIQALRDINDPYPYFRGLIADLGYEAAHVHFKQPLRKRGFTKNNFYTLYDMAMLGIANHSRVPLRLATMIGFGMSLLSMLVALAYLVAKLAYWERFVIGTAPIIIGVFFFGSLQLFFIGIIGEYVGTILTQVQRRPLVTEKERVNFEATKTHSTISQSRSTEGYLS